MLADPNIRDPNISGEAGAAITPDTKILQPPTEDAHIREYNPTAKHGLLTYCYYNPKATDECYCYYKFDFSGFPAGLTVTYAVLQVYNYILIAGSSQNIQLEAHRITAGWAESTICWNNKPSYAATVMGSVAMSTVWALGWVSIYLTEYDEVAQMISDANYGLMLMYNLTDAGHNYYRHYSRQYVTDPTLNPKLTITYE